MGTGILVAILAIIAIILTALHLTIKNTILRTIIVLVAGIAICVVVHTTPSIILGLLLISVEVIVNIVIKKAIEWRAGSNTTQE